MAHCHSCRYDARNGGTLADRQAHCLNCDFSEITLIENSRHCVNLDGSSYADFCVEKYAMPVNETRDYLAEKGINPNQVQMILDFCDAVCSLPVLDRLIVLAMISDGGDNNRLCTSTGLTRQTIIIHRKKLEAMPFWKNFLKVAEIAERKTRNREPAKPPKWGHGVPKALVEDETQKAAKRRGAEKSISEK